MRSRLRTGLIVFLALCVLLVGASYSYFRYQLGRLTKLDIPGLASDDDTGNIMNVLMVGSDSRENTTGYIADATGKGDEGATGQRSDTIMILHIDPSQEKATILSIPRDLYVAVPGNGKDKVNAAFSIGGPQLLIRTIREALGIEINHYLEIDFTGFQRIVDTIGGVKVYADYPARDANTGLDLPLAGCNEVDGYQALAFVRSRYYETYERGHWVPGANSDIERISRQQDFIRRIMKKAVSSGLDNPLTLNRLINIGVSNVRVDQAMSTKDITTLAKGFRSIDPDTVEMITLPTSDAFVGDAAVQLVDTAKAQEYIDRLNGVHAAPAPGAVNPADVAVAVLNGNGVTGGASLAGSSLGQAGFRVVSTGDAVSYDFAQTVVRYASGQQPKAAFLRSNLVAGAAIEEDKTLAGADVALVLGFDYNGLKAPAPASNSAPSTAATGARTSHTTTAPAC